MSKLDRLREAIQAVIDDDEEWQVSQFVIAMGIERIRDGEVQAGAWYYAPPGQPEWMTTGLLESSMELRAACDLED